MPDFINKIPDDYWAKLGKIYSDKKLEDEWKNEEKSLITIMNQILNILPEEYSLVEPKNIGGTSVISVVHNKKNNLMCALKFPRPINEKLTDFRKSLVEEISHLINVRHHNIIALYYHDAIDFRISDVITIGLPFYIMEYIEDSIDGEKYFGQNDISENNLVKIIQQVAKGIHHLHEMNIVHLDVKLENMLISLDDNNEVNRAVISDLGSARKLTISPPNDDEKITLIFDQRWASPKLMKLIKKFSQTGDPARFKGIEVPRSGLDKSFDLYSFGRNIHRIFEMVEKSKFSTKWKNIDPYTINYLKLMACRLIAANKHTEQKALGHDCYDFREITYEKISQVIEDISKLTGEYPLYKRIPELDFHSKKIVQPAGISKILPPFTDRVKHIIEDRTFRRLSNISQLGFLNLVYPTASHTRYEHTLGTYSNITRYCDALYHDPYNPIFKQVMNDSDLKAVLLAALFHDLGQYPLAHDVEEALAFDKKECLKKFSHIAVLERMLISPKEYFELEELLKYIQKEWRIESQRIIDIIKADPKQKEHYLKDRLLHTLIDSPLDADKLDYIFRDSTQLGIPIGNAIDFERLLRTLTVIFEIDNENKMLFLSLGLHEKGKVQAETLSFARYVLFGTAYWHHTSRAIKAMLHRSIWEIFYSNKGDFQKDNIKKFESEFNNYIKNLEIDPELISCYCTSQLSSADQQFITLLSKFTSSRCRTLLSLIEQRKLFKRLLVVRKVNDDLSREFMTLRNQWNGKIALEKSQDLQDLIVNEFNSNVKKLIANGFEEKNIAKTQDLMKNEIVILIDIPKKYSTDQKRLMYHPESDREVMHYKWKDPVPLEDSIFCNVLNDSVLESIGKIRIFVHPDIRDHIKEAVSEERLVRIVKDVIKYP